MDVSHLYVAQSLLPFLWRRADLGGRSFSVLMTRLPLSALHHQLDALASRYPDRKTFLEFRAPSWMVEEEAEALERADQIITPHAFLAKLFPRKTVRLKWNTPQAERAQSGDCIVFPGPALARKGACELREALHGLNYPLQLINGQATESEGFWDGVQLESRSGDWLNHAGMVVQPAFIENNPRPLLRALAAGIPVVATPECGVDFHPMLTLIPAGDVEALNGAIEKAMSSNTTMQTALPRF
jgi:hypothetical protein